MLECVLVQMDRQTYFTGFSHAHFVQARGRSQCHGKLPFFNGFNPAHVSGPPALRLG